MKSSLVFVTAALLLATALAGCSDSASSAPASTPGSQASASSEAAASSQATVSSAPVIEQNVSTSQSVTPTGQVVRPLPLTVDIANLGDFLTPGTQLPNGITPYNTTVRIEDGQVMDLFRIFVP